MSTSSREIGGVSIATSWLAALVGLWVLVSPFVLAGTFGSGNVTGTVNWTDPFWMTLIAGIVVTILAGIAGMTARGTNAGRSVNWLAALVGLWLIVSVFVLSGSVSSGLPYWSNIISGIIVAVLGGLSGILVNRSY